MNGVVKVMITLQFIFVVPVESSCALTMLFAE